jgi:heptosyltransferase-2
MMKKDIIHYDCRYFKGEIPCVFHKQEGVKCDTCKYYDKIAVKILIIKLDAIGDVLRTTCILQGLKEKYKFAHITWITHKTAIELFKNNEYVDVVLEYSPSSLIQIQLEKYDIVISLDTAPVSARIAMLAKSDKKLGFGYHERGFVYPLNKEAEKWFKMGLFDDIKKANTQTYQSIILEICGLKPEKYDIIFRLSKEEIEYINQRFVTIKDNNDALIIGLNTGAGTRWQLKAWTLQGYCRLIKLIQERINKCKILLLGGPEEIDRNRYILQRCNDVIDTGCDNTLREFGAIVNLCDIVVTGDTLALHIAVALKKKVVALFGPTSYTEIDIYGKGRKVYADIDCLCCYKKTCDIHPNCMELITPEMVMTAIEELIGVK